MRRETLVRLVLALVLLPVAAAWAQAPSPSPSADAMPTDLLAMPPSLAPALEPAWMRVQVPGGPAAREDHTWTVDFAGRFAYLFGGRDGERVFDDLWRFDLAADSWTRLRPPRPSPAPRSGHSAAWVEGHGLVVFAGQRGTDFYDDLWAYDPDRERWRRLPADGATPRARYGSCLVLAPDGRLRISHGFTFAGRFDDTRAYDLADERWVKVTPEGRRPGERCLHECFTSLDGDLVLYGGQDDGHVALGDLWSARADGTWRRLPEPRLPARRLYAVTEAGTDAWVFGGAGRDGRALDDLLRLDRTTLRFQPVAVAGPSPAGRYAATLIADRARGRLLLFGGISRQARSDLWQLVDVVAPRPPDG